MIQQIIDSFEKECEKSPDNMMLRMICDNVTEKLETASEDVLKNIIDKKLTIKGAIDKMRETASKRKCGNYAVLSDKEGLEIVYKYFGISRNDAAPKKPKTVSLFDII